MQCYLKNIFIFFLYLLFIQKTFAQTHQLSIYQTENGLSSNLTKDIVQDKWGFIWVASDEGVSRFDGRGFLNFKKELPINYTKGLFKTKSGRLLIINDLGVLEAISKPDTIIFRTILQGTNNALDDKKVMYPKEAFEDCHGNVWISEPSSVLRYNAGATKRYVLPKELNTTVYTRSFTFAETSCGRLYVGAFMGKILSYNESKDSFEVLNLPNDFKLVEISAILPINPNTIWVGDRNGITEISINDKIEVKKIAEVASVSCMAKDISGDFWIGTWEKGLHKLENIGGKWNIRKFWESRSNTINHLLADTQKNIWVATDDGIELLSSNTFNRLKLGKNNSYIQGIHSEAKENEGAFVCDQEAAYQITKKGKTYFKTEVYKRGHLLSLIKFNDKLFIGTGDDKLIVQEKGQNKEISMANYGRSVFFLEKDNNENVWVCQYGEKRSITKVDKNLKISQYTEKEGLGTFVEVIRTSKNGDIYIGGQGKDTYLYKFNAAGDKFENISIPIKKVAAQSMFKINDLCVDAKNRIWLGSTQGLYLLENKTLTQVDLGKRYNSETIKAVLIDDKDNIWIGTNIGILKYKNKNAVLFEKTNGLSTVSIGLKGLAQMADGSILVATSNGLNYMIANNEDAKKTPKPIFKSIKVNNHHNIILHEKTDEVFEYDYQSTLKVNFVSFVFPNENILYQYKIEGLNSEWSDASTQDQISLERLPAGKFKLLVRAIQQGNFIWSETTNFEFTILHPWYVRWWAWVLYIGLSIGLLFILVRINTYRLHRQKVNLTKKVNEATREIAEQAENLSQKNKELSVQRDALESAYRIIERKNGKILDSIRYAQTIQQIILPSQDFLNRLCDESFILYKPRDVVSGDFYWAYKQENKWFLAVVDCTGHGVPGAFMSMIAYSLIYRAIKVKHQYDPAKILELLHAETRVVMRQKDGINTDGMDLCLCVLEENKYNKDEFTLTYSGAKRPLYLVKDNEFMILEECRKSVGGIQSKNVLFENRTVNIKRGDKLYLTTDGLADQNNIDRKKITERKVQEIIKEIHLLPLTEQNSFIEKVLKEHQEGTEQRDDITMLAVKL
ncbi:MAG: hypothetical protein EAZ85_02145 [Bacteroidetes bacterium]|nr:MAG: hypothetical protein EAZ85_02145 [Bacteroidota bacterium]TAG89624.1 MAG: hypothetical protein EAZ20_06050 [Bacteroidota bacterium]